MTDSDKRRYGPSEAMGSEQVLFQRICIPVGGTDREFVAQQHAVGVAAALGVPVIGLYVGSEEAPEALWDYLRDAGRRWQVEVQTRSILGTDVATLVADEVEATDLVVIGTERMGTRYRVGSVAEELMRLVRGAVMVVRLEG